MYSSGAFLAPSKPVKSIPPAFAENMRTASPYAGFSSSIAGIITGVVVLDHNGTWEQGRY